LSKHKLTKIDKDLQKILVKEKNILSGMQRNRKLYLIVDGHLLNN